MARKEQKEIKCIVEFTEGAVDRITAAFADTYQDIKAGIYKGPLRESKEEETA